MHFLRWAGHVMRSVIVDFARRRTAERRGGGADHVALTTGLADERTGSAEEILAVHEALDELAAVDARLAQVVELRYFGGLTEPEIAAGAGRHGADRAAGLAEGAVAAPGRAGVSVSGFRLPSA